MKAIQFYKLSLMTGLFVVLLLFLEGRIGVATIYANLGSVALMRSTFTSNSALSQKLLKQAETLFSQSVGTSDLYRGWRGLGMSLIKQNSDNNAVRAWQQSPKIIKELLLRGHIAHKTKNYEEALKWYRLAVDVSPELGDAWYYLGLTLQSQERRTEALEAYNQALSTNLFSQIDISDIYYRQAVIYQWFPPHQNVDKALDLYDNALSLDKFSSAGLKAQAFYMRGVIYEWQKRSWNDVVEQYQQAVELRPSDYWAHLRLGYALYWEYKNITLAESEFEKALALWPDNNERFWFYRFSGDVYFDSELEYKACEAYKNALQIESNNTILLEKLKQLSISCLSD